MSENNKIILYQDDNEIIRVSVRFSDEDLWLTQNQLAEIYCTTQQNISQHVDNIYKDGEVFILAKMFPCSSCSWLLAMSVRLI